MAVVGISCFFHDSAVALLGDSGEILCAVQEERFSRKKHDNRFPFCALQYCLQVANEKGLKIDAYVYYEKPIRIFTRLVETYFATAPRGFSSFRPAMKSWIGDKLFMRNNLENSIKKLDTTFTADKLFFSEHHLSHACAAYFPSGFSDSLVLCMDAVGEYATTTLWYGKGNQLKKIWSINFPDSLGMLYSSFTYYCGFKVNSGEYKLMGLAPYGSPQYRDLILQKLVKLNPDGSFNLDTKYFKYQRGLRMISTQFIRLFGRHPRHPDEPIDQFFMDIAASIQSALETIVDHMVTSISKDYPNHNLCLSGGVALNCVNNGKISRSGKFKNLWIQPASGDAGSSLGAAYAYHFLTKNNQRFPKTPDSMNNSYLGPYFTDQQIVQFLKDIGVEHDLLNSHETCASAAASLSKGRVIGWFQGAAEFGPRSLGNRSILGDPRDPSMQSRMNLKIKNRESFRPFAPAILQEKSMEYFGISDSPYMLLTSDINPKYRLHESSRSSSTSTDIISQINQQRSSLPAITHVDYSCRVQTLTPERNKLFYELVLEFYKITSCPVVINTSFNVRGEPPVLTPEDALKCFAYTDIDELYLGNVKITRASLTESIFASLPKPVTIED